MRCNPKCRKSSRYNDSREDQLQAAFSFIWKTSRNYIIDYIIKKKPNYDYCLDDIDVAGEENTDALDEKKIMRQQILVEIDKEIKGQTVINTTNAVFLMLLRDYIIVNDYDVRGFGEYVREEMNLKMHIYNAIASRLGIRTKVLNEKLLAKPKMK